MAVDTGAEGYDAFPLQSFLDFDVRDGPDGAAVAFLEVDDRHLNPNGIVHGGVVFTLADTAMGWATLAVLDDGVCPLPPFPPGVEPFAGGAGLGWGKDGEGGCCTGKETSIGCPL